MVKCRNFTSGSIFNLLLDLFSLTIFQFFLDLLETKVRSQILKDEICEDKKSWCSAVVPDCSLELTKKHCAKYCGICQGTALTITFRTGNTINARG